MPEAAGTLLDDTESSLLEIAETELDRAGGDKTRAAMSLTSIALKDHTYTSYLVHMGARELLHKCSTSLRFGFTKNAIGDKLSKIREEKSERFGLMEQWYLESGVRLAKAQRIHLIAAAEHIEQTAAGLLSRAILYRTIAAKLGDDFTLVEAVFSDDDVRSMFEQAAKTAAGLVKVIHAQYK